MTKPGPVRIAQSVISGVLNQNKVVGWNLGSYNGTHCLEKSFRTSNFENTSGFINQINMASHKKGHHPKVTYGYNTVEIVLQTHDVGGVSTFDVEMAGRIDKFAKKFLAKEK